MLPGLIAGHYGWRACFIDLEVLARFAGARLLRDIAIRLDLERKLVRCADATEVGYDIVSVDVGSVANGPAVAESDRRGMAVRPVQRFVSAWDGFVHQAADQELNLVVVCAGAAGIELCLSMQHRLQRRVPHNRVKFGLVALGADILPDHNAGLRERCCRRATWRSELAAASWESTITISFWKAATRCQPIKSFGRPRPRRPALARR